MNHKAFFVVATLLVLLALLPSAGRVVAQGPTPAGGTISYSGRLSNDAGHAVADGGYALTFALYDAAKDGNLLWSETQTGVTVKGRAFTALLGSVKSLSREARISKGWLAVSVRGPGETGFTELAPRQPLNAALPAVPSSPAAGPSCPHDHFGETWTGVSTGTGYGLGIVDTRTDGIGISVLTEHGSDAIGVLGVSSGTGVAGFSSDKEGVHGETSANTWSAVVGVHTGTSGSGVGVWGEARTTAGAGILAYNTHNTGTALDIKQGAFKVEGAGVDTSTTVFMHKVAEGIAGNICQSSNYATVIDNPLTNNNPDVILIVTPNYRKSDGTQSNSLGPAKDIPAVFYSLAGRCPGNDNKWVIYNLNATAMVNNTYYNVMVVKP